MLCLVVFAGCATTRVTPELDARLDRIATRAVDVVINGGPVPQLAPTSLDPLPPNLEVVHFASHDGLELRAWLVAPAGSARATIIVLPGWASAVEFALDQCGFLVDAGYRLVLLDPRANLFRGRAGEFHAWLDEDLCDVDTALAWVGTRPEIDRGKLILLGFSWGGLKALLTAAHHPEVRAVIDDAGSTPESPFTKHFNEFAPPAARTDPVSKARYLRLVDEKLSARHGFTLAKFDVLAAAKALAPRPLMIIHSSDDGFVPMQVSERLFAAAREPKTFLRATNFGHGLGARRNPASYTPAVLAFLKTVFP